jgi:hypothetical protein
MQPGLAGGRTSGLNPPAPHIPAGSVFQTPQASASHHDANRIGNFLNDGKKNRMSKRFPRGGYGRQAMRCPSASPTDWQTTKNRDRGNLPHGESRRENHSPRIPRERTGPDSSPGKDTHDRALRGVSMLAGLETSPNAPPAAPWPSPSLRLRKPPPYRAEILRSPHRSQRIRQHPPH